MREMNGKYVGNRPIKLRKSSWKDRQLEVVKKKTKEKRKLGYRVWEKIATAPLKNKSLKTPQFLEYARQMSEQLLRRILPEEKFTARG